MIGKILGISFIIVSFLHFYLLSVIELKSNNLIQKSKKDKVDFIKLTNYQIKKITPKIEPKIIEKPIKKEVKKVPKKIVKKIFKPKKIKKIEPKVIEKPKIIKEITKPKEVVKEIPKEVVNAPKIVQKVKEVPPKKFISKEINRELEKIKTIYANELRRKIEEYKSYPRIARKLGQEGSVEVKFTILDNGLIKDIKILKPSNYDRLNSATLKTLKEINRFKPIPKELKLSQWDFILPIEFKLN